MNRHQRIFLALFTLFSTLVATERTHAQGREPGCDGTKQQIGAGILGDGSATIVFTNSEGTYIRGIFTQDGEAEWVFSNPLWSMWGKDGGWPDDCPRPQRKPPKMIAPITPKMIRLTPPTVAERPRPLPPHSNPLVLVNWISPATTTSKKMNLHFSFGWKKS